MVVDADGQPLPGNGSVATPYQLPAVVATDTCTIVWQGGRTGTALNPIEGEVPLDPAGVLSCGPDGLLAPSLCDQTLALPVDVPALTDRVVLTDGTDCKTALVSDLPAPTPDACSVAQTFFSGLPTAVPALTAAGIMAVVSDGAGGWLCRYVTNDIGISTPVYGGSGSPPVGQGSNSIALGPNGQDLVLRALGGINVDTNALIPGEVQFSVRDSNVAWAFAGTPATGGSNIYVDPTTRRLYGEPAYLQADTTSHTLDGVVGTLALAANVKTFTAAAHTVILNNPSASRAMRTQFIATWGGVNMSRNTLVNLNWNLDWMVNAAIIDFGYMGILLAAAPVATISSNEFASYPVGNFTIAAGGSATFQTRPWLLASAATTASRLGTGYRYGVSVHGWSL